MQYIRGLLISATGSYRQGPTLIPGRAGLQYVNISSEIVKFLLKRPMIDQ